MLLKKHFALPVLIFCAANFVFADTIQLKDKAAVTGKILAEKPDSIVVDVGYTVLVMPRSSISAISKANETALKSGFVCESARSTSTRRNFITPTAASPARDVSSLVKQIGEAVVQVRTPEGLGSGFFINADGYLITNFHVIEGETEISVEVYRQTRRPPRTRDLQAGQHHRHQQISRPRAAAHRGQKCAEVQIRHARQFGCVERGRFRFCHRQPARPGAHRDRRAFSAPRRANWRASFICKRPRKSIPATAAARCSISPAKSWA